jgi:hypothetical protein
LLKAHFARLKVAEASEIEANGYFTEPEWKEVISPDGVKCFVTRFRAPTPPVGARAAELIATIPTDLSIPSFLKRSPHES